ncbi:hypothetical protein, partial [Roseibium sp.]|uniref:hypothetical protein n=1 Tax=Roseibium sp. TaxID=1936156 RepID=UPI003A9830B0
TNRLPCLKDQRTCVTTLTTNHKGQSARATPSTLPFLQISNCQRTLPKLGRTGHRVTRFKSENPFHCLAEPTGESAVCWQRRRRWSGLYAPPPDESTSFVKKDSHSLRGPSFWQKSAGFPMWMKIAKLEFLLFDQNFIGVDAFLRERKTWAPAAAVLASSKSSKIGMLPSAFARCPRSCLRTI